MKHSISRIERRVLLRWSVNAVFLALALSVAPEYWAADRLPRTLEMVRCVGTLALLALAAGLVWMRHASPRRTFPLHVAIATIIMSEPVLKVGLTARVVAMLVVWVVAMWMEWRRIVEEERQLA